MVEETEPPAKKRSGMRETLIFVLAGVFVAVLVHMFVMQSFYIPSESMENTLLVNDRVLVNKLAYRFGDVSRGDIVVFKGWDGEDTIKRVIGVGGDTVTCCDSKHRLSVNGTPIEETSYLYPGVYASDSKFTVKVPAGRVWLMGDNRSNSRDARSYMENEFKGTIAVDDIIGRAFVRYWPFSRLGWLSHPSTFDPVRP
ncbi:signal peptidase I [Streptosporangiaceae bacterium NEAU-GS5]|nr:signal peptidase I [Streptosporangiaceae bacterium NEAU-GS5]